MPLKQIVTPQPLWLPDLVNPDPKKQLSRARAVGDRKDKHSKKRITHEGIVIRPSTPELNKHNEGKKQRCALNAGRQLSETICWVRLHAAFLSADSICPRPKTEEKQTMSNTVGSLSPVPGREKRAQGRDRVALNAGCR
jgi:hypothetical protein